MQLRLPHPLVLLLGGVAVAAALTWVLPAGSYERHADKATGREVVVNGTYARVAPAPVGPAAAVLSVPKGFVAGADVILTVLFVGGAFALLDRTGALARLVGALVGRTRRPRLVLFGVCVIFATLGALENMQEEIIALVPVLLVLSRGLGFGAVTAVAMSAGSAAIGAAFGPTNPYQTGIALRFAELPALSQPVLRFALFVCALGVWIGWTVGMAPRDDVRPEVTAPATEPATTRDLLMFAVVMLAFIPYVIGVVKLDWGFNELSGLFLVAGFAVGLISGRGLSETAVDLLEGMKTLLPPALFIGVARAISVVLTDGRVIDTIVHGLATPLERVPGVAAALLMVPVHALIHVPVSSVSGQAVLTMPIMAPLADLLGFSRDAAVIAYQTGAGLTELLTPTNGALLAVLLSARLGLGRWLRFAIPGTLLVAVIGVAGIALAR
jgi:uncharacterized ion transporter superfamily protein YfcC